ncbi:hypothetical protein CEXT_187031 [Caerostris extrusa]|uniref:Uncharacterized protein n=1 Tax=Caerostris extrusa TaxID=172846 RepID=A0AAV4RX48_CAEEX|nr:hypothetical protein CEXT_187031 [Caerostris extrusa]
MKSQIKFQIWILFLCFIYAIGDEIPKEKKISMSVPTLTEEEIDSNHMPFHMKCDACRAISFQIQQAFTKAKGKKII